MSTPTYDCIVIGGGIVGLSSALAVLERAPEARIVVVEKEHRCAAHQTGHNSGVIHSGLYYKPGSLKARYAVEGNRALREFCSAHGIAHEICGKVVVATSAAEIGPLEELHRRGSANGLRVRRIGREELREIEPHAEGIAALHVPEAGIVDYRQVAEAFARLITQRGGEILLGTRVRDVREDAAEVIVETDSGPLSPHFLVNCAGLYSDRIARLSGIDPGAQIVPFRGEYYDLLPESRGLVRGMIYPVPDPAFPFLGVHLTRSIDGGVHAGPNAVLALRREGYRKTDVNAAEMMETLTFGGFWRLAGRHWQEGAKEVLRSVSKRAFVKSLQKLVPAVAIDDLGPGSAGVRAQALGRDGRMIDDFRIVGGPRSAHVCNAPSPAATACIPIGRHIAGRVRFPQLVSRQESRS